MNVKISPDQLRSLRAARGFSQSRLAKTARVAERQIQRFESSASATLNVREETLKRLSAALHVHPRVLAGELPLPETIQTRERDNSPSRQVTVKLDTRTQLNYDLVEERYGASFKDLINLAPVLFVLLAEKAMKRKEAWVDEQLAEGDLEDEDLLLNPGEDDDTRLLQSVEIFGLDRGGDLDYLNQNPLVDQLHQEIAALDDPLRARFNYFAGNSIGALLYHPGDRVPETEVCRHELMAITCRDPAAIFALKLHGIRIRDIPTELLQTDRAIERIEWLRSRAGAAASAADSDKSGGAQ